ncbi:glutathione S-transferase N-terminal domain-containing protein [Sodalis endosymbiont of Spalangia cameroni]|uniref:glutathione S-transferase family protein n=1 Tax=Sodalis praecaptivus TaxID=1239307 RepID=UPI0031F73028
MNETKIILHHYAISPYSTKVRVILGLKQIRWYACNQPGLMPKDDLITLTGGYRRIPILQIGADLFFDSNLIIHEVERRFPTPTVFGGSGPGVGLGFAPWPDAILMLIAHLLYGGDRDSTPEYRADRSALLGMDFDVDAMARAWPANAEKLRLHLALLAAQLADGRPFITGNAPDIIDAAFYGLIEYMYCGKGKTAALVNAFPIIKTWTTRMRLIGQGERREISAAKTLAIAKAATPRYAVETPSHLLPHEPAPGDRVSVKYYDNNTPVLYGTLMHISPYRVAILRDDATLGPIMLHMPRTLGQIARADGGAAIS